MLPGAWGHSVTVVEFAQLPAGLAAWQRQSLGIYRVCGPVSKMLYALPAYMAGVRVDYPTELDSNEQGREEWGLGERFQRQYVQSYHHIYRVSRLLPIVVTLLAGGLVCEWSTRLMGAWPGVVSMATWCWLPPVLAHGALVTSDVISAATMLLASRLFWAFLLRPRLAGAGAAGAALGLAAATKFTLLVLYPCWALLVFGRILKACGPRADDPHYKPNTTVRMLTLALVMLVASVIVFDGCYLFQRVGFRLADWQSRQSSLANLARLLEDQSELAWLLKVPLPFPLEALRGIDVQIADTERPQSAYLLGSSRLGGWWYWYLAAALLKIPLPALGLLILALTHLPAIVRQGGDRALLAAPCVLLPAVESAVAIMVSTGTGSNAAFRYMLPALVLLCVCAGAAVAAGSSASRATAKVFLGWLAVNAALGVPDHLGWHNELGWAWERSRGLPVLIGDNLDWGQDLDRLGQWVKRHAVDGSTSVCVYGFGGGAAYGLSPPAARSISSGEVETTFLAVSANLLHDQRSPATISVGGTGAWLTPSLRSELLSRRPVDRVGCSISVYRMSGSTED